MGKLIEGKRVDGHWGPFRNMKIFDFQWRKGGGASHSTSISFQFLQLLKKWKKWSCEWAQWARAEAINNNLQFHFNKSTNKSNFFDLMDWLLMKWRVVGLLRPPSQQQQIQQINSRNQNYFDFIDWCWIAGLLAWAGQPAFAHWFHKIKILFHQFAQITGIIKKRKHFFSSSLIGFVLFFSSWLAESTKSINCAPSERQQLIGLLVAFSSLWNELVMAGDQPSSAANTTIPFNLWIPLLIVFALLIHLKRRKGRVCWVDKEKNERMKWNGDWLEWMTGVKTYNQPPRPHFFLKKWKSGQPFTIPSISFTSFKQKTLFFIFIQWNQLWNWWSWLKIYYNSN